MRQPDFYRYPRIIFVRAIDEELVSDAGRSV
jgi:hypothetical protein